MQDLPDHVTVTVCDQCMRVCCWHGIFLCDKSREAGTKDVTIGFLRSFNAKTPSEHEDYWEYDYNVRDWRARRPSEGRTGE